MRRGEIHFADLDPTRGSETGKRRPVLIVSNDASNRAGTTVTVLPITSNVTRVYPFEVLLEAAAGGLAKPSKIQAQQIRTVSKEHLSAKPVGVLSTDLMQAVEAAIRLHLGLKN